MAHFAKLDADGTVTGVYCVNNMVMTDSDGNESEQMGIDFLSKLYDGGIWVQTSYNTRAGVHKLGGTPLRANYCRIGGVFDGQFDIFRPPQPYPSWTLDTVKGCWNPPVPRPEPEKGEDGRPLNWYQWNEEAQEWDKKDLTWV